jgi:hypothetical protein
VFRLPFLQFAVGWSFAALLVVLIVTAVFHYVNGGIRLQSPFQRVTPQVKVHLSVILALMALTKTVQYYLARYELLFSHRGVVDGAGYTDIKAQLPALNFLMIISIAAAVLFIANIFRRGWVFPIIAVGLWGFISIVVGTIYPAYIQRIQVQPNEFSREQPYIKRNITATRAAFGLDNSHVVTHGFSYKENIDAADVNDDKASLDNARLWDPSALTDAFKALQEIKPYLAFNDVDVDRYKVGVDPKLPAMISSRELDATHIPSRTWTNTHLVYTHGYSAVIAAANAVDGADPSFLSSEIPPTGEITVDQPGIYYGENLGGFAVVNTKVDEIEPAAGDTERKTNYTGRGGVKTSSFVRKAALALRFGSWDLFVSGQINASSRVLYMRDIRDRVKTAAPFLDFDADPYPVVLNGKVLWVIDGYTTTDRYPYSQSLHPGPLPPGSGLDHDFNYVRNSVKATVDAYDGTVKFYVVDENDPLIKAYRKAFPNLFTDVDKMPEGLRDHWRYPEDLFRSQTEQYSIYHMTDAQQFYGKEDLWDIAPNPVQTEATAANASASATTVRGNNGGRNNTLSAGTSPIEPLYQTLQLPGEDGQEFVLTRPFVPRGKENQMTAFMAARSDPGHYGQLVLYNTPDNTTPSPSKAGTLIESEQKISEQFTLLGQQGSDVLRGQVQLIPIGDSILYVRPIWVEGKGASSYPRFRFVAMTYGEKAVLATSVDGAIDGLFGGGATTPTEPTEPTQPTQPTQPSNDTVAQLLEKAANEFAEAKKVQGTDLGAYQEHITKAQGYVQDAQRLLDQESGSTTTSTTTPGSTTSTSAPRATTTTAAP